MFESVILLLHLAAIGWIPMQLVDFPFISQPMSSMWKMVDMSIMLAAIRIGFATRIQFRGWISMLT